MLDPWRMNIVMKWKWHHTSEWVSLTKRVFYVILFALRNDSLHLHLLILSYALFWVFTPTHPLYPKWHPKVPRNVGVVLLHMAYHAKSVDKMVMSCTLDGQCLATIHSCMIQSSCGSQQCCVLCIATVNLPLTTVSMWTMYVYNN